MRISKVLYVIYLLVHRTSEYGSRRNRL